MTSFQQNYGGYIMSTAEKQKSSIKQFLVKWGGLIWAVVTVLGIFMPFCTVSAEVFGYSES